MSRRERKVQWRKERAEVIIVEKGIKRVTGERERGKEANGW